LGYDYILFSASQFLAKNILDFLMRMNIINIDLNFDKEILG